MNRIPDTLLDAILASKTGGAISMFVLLATTVASIFAVYALGTWLAGQTVGIVAVFAYLIGLLSVMSVIDD